MKTGTHIRYKKETDKELTGIVVETFLENGTTFYLVDTYGGIDIVKPIEICLIEFDNPPRHV